MVHGNNNCLPDHQFLLQEQIKKIFTDLFYQHNNNKKKYRFFGIPLFSLTTYENKKVLKTLGIKFTYNKTATKNINNENNHNDEKTDLIKQYASKFNKNN